MVASLASTLERGRELIRRHGSVKAALHATHPDHGGERGEFEAVLAARDSTVTASHFVLWPDDVASDAPGTARGLDASLELAARQLDGRPLVVVDTGGEPAISGASVMEVITHSSRPRLLFDGRPLVLERSKLSGAAFVKGQLRVAYRDGGGLVVSAEARG